MRVKQRISQTSNADEERSAIEALHGGRGRPNRSGSLIAGLRERRERGALTLELSSSRIIAVLTDGLGAIAKGSAAYHRQMLDSGSKFEAAAS